MPPKKVTSAAGQNTQPSPHPGGNQQKKTSTGGEGGTKAPAAKAGNLQKPTEKLSDTRTGIAIASAGSKAIAQVHQVPTGIQRAPGTPAGKVTKKATKNPGASKKPTKKATGSVTSNASSASSGSQRLGIPGGAPHQTRANRGKSFRNRVEAEVREKRYFRYFTRNMLIGLGLCAALVLSVTIVLVVVLVVY